MKIKLLPHCVLNNECVEIQLEYNDYLDRMKISFKKLVTGFLVTVEIHPNNSESIFVKSLPIDIRYVGTE